jgi:hypothetical protein
MSDQFPICEVRLPWFSLVWAARVKSWPSSKTRTCKKREAGGSSLRSTLSQRAAGAPTSKRGLLSRAAGVASLLLLVGSVVADVPGPVNTVPAGKPSAPPRMLGKKAVMHVYSYVPMTLEITSATSHFFKDVDACERAVGRALRAATSHAREGDLVDAQCVAIEPPEAIAQPEPRHGLAEATEL